MVLGTAVDLSDLSYLLLVIMKEQGTVVGRGKACPQLSGEAEPALRRWARRSQPLAIGRGEASPQPSGEAEPALSHRARRSQSPVVERCEVYP